MRSCSDYRAAARQSLSGLWSESAVVILIIYILACLFSVPSAVLNDPAYLTWMYTLSAVGTLASIFLLMPLQYGFDNAMLSAARQEGYPFSNSFAFFRRDYSRSVPALLLVGLAEIGLGIITLGIGAIYLQYAYAMVPFLLRDYPTLSATEAMRTSRQMMRGHKWDLFLLDLTFIGWFFLAVCTFGIGFLWLAPYVSAAHAHFYEDLKAETIVED